MNLLTQVKVKITYAALTLAILFACSVALTPAALAANPITVGGKALVINTDGSTIRVRDGAGVQNDQIAEAYEGQTVKVLAGPSKDSKGDSWYKIQGPGGTGWIRRDFISGITGSASASIAKAAKAAPSTPKLSGFARVANTDGDSLRVRSQASHSGSVLTTLTASTLVIIKKGPTVDSANTAWYQVSADGVTGWAMAQYLVQAQAPAQKAVIAQPAAKAVAQPAADAARSATSRGAQPAAAGHSSLGGSFVSIAMTYVGSRYRFGGMSPKGFDCSGLVAYVMTKAGKSMSHDMSTQFRSGTRVSSKDLQPGDLLFFSNTYKRGLSHVGIYIGNGRFVHAENESTGVTVSSVWSAYWVAHYTAAVRVK